MTKKLSRFGKPKVVVSATIDKQFRSAKFQLMNKSGVQDLFFSPYYRMSNSQTERIVNYVKRSLQKLAEEGTNRSTPKNVF